MRRTHGHFQFAWGGLVLTSLGRIACCMQGALVANYPWDGSPNKTTEYVACPDDDTYRHLASTYASTHATMTKPGNKVPV